MRLPPTRRSVTYATIGARRRNDLMRRAIAYYEIAATGWSALTIWRILSNAQGVTIPWSVILMIIGFLTLLLASGVLLLRKKALGEPLSIVAQSLQVLQITIDPVAFRLVAGLQATIYFFGERFGAYVGMTASVGLWRGPGEAPFAIGVNLVPLTVVALIVWLAQAPTHSERCE